MASDGETRIVVLWALFGLHLVGMLQPSVCDPVHGISAHRSTGLVLNGICPACERTTDGTLKAVAVPGQA